MSDAVKYGDRDASFRAAGGEAGIRRLCEDFYAEMRTLPEAKTIFEMHSEDLTVITDKLATFLCAWLGGPPHFIETYRAKYGPIHIPSAHRHLVINEPERDAWLLCMKRALEKQPYAPEFREYLNQQFYFPAERIRQTSLFEPKA